MKMSLLTAAGNLECTYFYSSPSFQPRASWFVTVLGIHPQANPAPPGRGASIIKVTLI
jgi:hypothetical protein